MSQLSILPPTMDMGQIKEQHVALVLLNINLNIATL